MTKQYFKVGDKVTCSMYGKGEIANVNKHGSIRVLFKNGFLLHYSFDGKLSNETKRTLHQGHIDIPEPELKEIVTFEKGEYVWVKDNHTREWDCKRFSRFVEGKPVCNGQEGSNEYTWNEIRKYEDRPF